MLRRESRPDRSFALIGIILAASVPALICAAAQVPQAGGDQPQLSSAKIDFVPGERTIFYDDFSDMAQDEPPPHWKVRNGKVDLRVGGNVRELYAAEEVELTSPPLAPPKNFTFEVEWTGGGEMSFVFLTKADEEAIHAMVRGEEDGMTANTSLDIGEHIGEGGIQANTSEPVKYALWVQEGRVRVYLNGERVVDANQIDVQPWTTIRAHLAGYRPNGLRKVRLAESAPDFSKAITSAGKYVTHGINFDTDSARLKPESAAVIRQVAAGLQKSPNLKLEIDGYTDSVGDEAHNLQLSKGRAEAVKAVLTAQFGVDASRLTANGFGAAKPIASNDTPDGRASNRRVEFVKR